MFKVESSWISFIQRVRGVRAVAGGAEEFARAGGSRLVGFTDFVFLLFLGRS